MIEEQLIRERAHSIWESEGRPSGRADAHWTLASAQLAAETPPARKSAPRRKATAAEAPAPQVKAKAATARKVSKAAKAD